MAKRPLGYRGTQVLLFIRRHKRAKGRVPSYLEICRELDFNDRAEVCRVVERLEARGLIRRSGYGRQRRIEIAA